MFCHQLIEHQEVNAPGKHKLTFIIQRKLEDLYLEQKLLHYIMANYS